MGRRPVPGVRRCSRCHRIMYEDTQKRTCDRCRETARRYYVRVRARTPRPCDWCGSPALVGYPACAEHVGAHLLRCHEQAMNVPRGLAFRQQGKCDFCDKPSLFGYDQCEDHVGAVLQRAQELATRIHKCPVCFTSNCEHHPQPRYCKQCGQQMPWSWGDRQFCWNCNHGVQTEEEWTDAVAAGLLPDPVPYPFRPNSRKRKYCEPAEPPVSEAGGASGDGLGQLQYHIDDLPSRDRSGAGDPGNPDGVRDQPPR